MAHVHMVLSYPPAHSGKPADMTLSTWRIFRIRWTLDIPETAGAVLCHACGLYQASYGRPRPAAFVLPDEASEVGDDD
jgi:hypothetical protein